MQLIVLGMHRSGTSVLARVLNLMGVYFGPEGSSTGANWENPKGFWERRDVRKLNDLVLNSIGCDWNRLSTFDLARVPRSVLEEFETTAAKLVLEMDAHRPWLLKEPRLELLLPLWLRFLEVPVCINIYRHPVEVAASLKRRNEIPIPAGLALWELYVRSALAGSQGLPSVVVSHRRLMEQPAAEVAGLFERLNAAGVPALRAPTAREVEAFIQSDLYRERETNEDLVEFRDAPQVQLFEKLMAGRPLATKRLAGSDRDRHTLVEYETSLPPLSSKLLAELEQRDVNLKTASEALKKARGDSDGQAAKVAALEKAALESAAAHKSQLGERDAKLSELKAHLAAEREALAEAKSLLAQKDKVIGDLGAEERASKQAAEALRLQLTGRVEFLQTGVSARDADILALKADLATEQAAAAEARTTIAEFERKLVAAMADIQQWRAASIDREARLREMRAQLADAEERLKGRFEETAKLTALLLAAEKSDADRAAACSAAEQDCARLRSDLAAADAIEQQLQLTLSKLEHAQSSLGHSQSSLGQAQSRLAEVERSWTWRLTRPFRGAARRAKGLFRSSPAPDGDRELIITSGWFDGAWYLRRYPDVAASGMDPAEHYLQHGWLELRLPGPRFDTDFYLRNNEDVANSRINPLVHFLRHGRMESRKPQDHTEDDAPA